MGNQKNNTNESKYKTETNSQTQKTNLWLPKGKGGGKKLEVWDNEIHITIHKTNKDLLYSTWNYGHPQWLSDKESACNAGDTGDVGLIPGSGRSPGVGNGNPL